MAKQTKRGPAQTRYKPARAPSRTANLLRQPFAASVRDLASDGRGILTHPSGLTVFVEGVWPGESGTFQLTEIKNRWALGTLVELSLRSPHRVTPFCPHHGVSTTRNNQSDHKCGGCPWQFMAYPEQLRAQQERVEKALKKTVSADVHIQPIQASTSTRAFRVRAQLKTDGEQIGYHSFSSNLLAAIEQCPILTSHNQNTLRELIAQLPNKHWKPGKKDRHTSLHIDESVDAGQVRVNKRLPFQQSHAQQNQFMRDWLSQKLQGLQELGTDLVVLELFCGSGNFTEVIALAGAQHITAVDSVSEATEKLRQRQLSGVEILDLDLYTGDAFEKIFSLRKDFTTLVLDPPRAGLQNTRGLFPRDHSIKDIFYISCDLATFCRDVDFLNGNGFFVKEVQPVDIAPYTPHVELLAHIQSANS